MFVNTEAINIEPPRREGGGAAVTAAAEPDTYICSGGRRRGDTEESEIKRDACGRQAGRDRPASCHQRARFSQTGTKLAAPLTPHHPPASSLLPPLSCNPSPWGLSRYKTSRKGRNPGPGRLAPSYQACELKLALGSRTSAVHTTRRLADMTSVWHARGARSNFTMGVASSLAC